MIFNKYCKLFFFVIGLLLLTNCNRGGEQVKYVPLSIDYTVNGNSKVIPTNLYAGIPFIKDVEKVFQVNTNSTTQLSAAISPTNRVENIEWFLDDADRPFATGQKTTHDFTEEGLHKLFVCINDSYKCTSKYIYIVDASIEEEVQVIDTPDPPAAVPTPTPKVEEEKSPIQPVIPIVKTPAPPINDKDNDGVPNDMDECEDEFGLSKFNGCPDSDGDNIPDKYDRYKYNKGGSSHDLRIVNQPPVKPPVEVVEAPPPVVPTPKNVGEKPSGILDVPVPIDPSPIEVEEELEEPECNITQTDQQIGPSAKDRCPNPTFIDEAVIELKPKRCIKLRSISLSSNASGSVKLYLKNDKGKKSDEVTAGINSGGISQISKIKEVYMSLQAGRTYTLHIAPITNNLQFENLSSCNAPAINDENLSINYNGQTIVMDLNYAY